VTNPLLDGVIAFVTARCNGNVSDKGIVVGRASGQDNSDTTYAPRNAVDLTASSLFYSANQWNCYDRGDWRIKPTHYSIHSRYECGSDTSHPKTWVLEGCTDWNQWDEVDRRDNNNDLIAQNVLRLFTVTHSSEYHSLRLRQTRSNRTGAPCLVMSGSCVFRRFFEIQQEAVRWYVR
jgi:hypothetical protein